MSLKDTIEGYGIVSRVIHWTMAVGIVATFALGYWMVGLDYYSSYYTSAPDFHRSIGIVLFFVLGMRLVWRVVSVRPSDQELTSFERKAARLVHASFYPLIIAVTVSGYLISTLDGRSIDVFGLISIPSIIEAKGYEDSAGLIHEYLSYATLALASVHALAALKHHMLDQHNTLTRMWSGPTKNR
ncbi:MAG: cytochrome B [Hyphomicrobium sp.]|nr:MAG: cytochrome B [Hyphomicrobium sp.]PPD00378.1 MAG: cytochrome B [Hyphomicrobium sp.]